MTDDKQTPPDWVLIEAAKRSGWQNTTMDELRVAYACRDMFRALCDALIAPPIEPPVDRKLLCAREAAVAYGFSQDSMLCDVGVRAIELWEEGFGK